MRHTFAPVEVDINFPFAPLSDLKKELGVDGSGGGYPDQIELVLRGDAAYALLRKGERAYQRQR